jgi:cyclopropane fatty-acyl-phospholipid synthase-like methyltransferase
MVVGDWILLLGAALIVGTAYFVFASFAYGAGYQPAPRTVVTRMLDLAAVGPDDTLYDLGAGTGAVVFRAARERGAHAVGVEVEPLRVLLLRLRRRFGTNADRVEIRWGNLFDQDLRRATVVAVFLWPEAMRRLLPVLEARLPAGARVVSHWHPLPGRVPQVFDRPTRVYLYQWPPQREPSAA